MKKILTTLAVLLLLTGSTFSQISEELLKKAEQGDAKAQFDLALAYQNNEDSEQALYWLHQAAEQNDMNAQDLLGCPVLI